MFPIYKDKAIQWNKATPAKLIDYSNLNVAVIGGTNGLGRALSKELANNGAKVTVVGRTFRDEASANINFIKADLGLINECERIGNELNKLNSQKNWTHVIFTTGILASTSREETSDGIEKDMAVSYLSRYIILNEMASNLKEKFEYKEKNSNGKSQSLKPRVFIMGFPGCQLVGDPKNMNATNGNYRAMTAHHNTVAANESLVLNYLYEANKGKYQFNVYGLNPGIIQTDIRSNFYGRRSWIQYISEMIISWTTQNAETYAQKIVPLLVTPDIENHNGTMFNNNADAIYPSKKMTPNIVEEFQKYSKDLVEFGKNNRD